MKRVIGYHNILKKDYPTILQINDSTLNLKIETVNENYFDEVREFLEKKEIPDTLIKYFFQPIQIIYFRNGEAYAFTANCFIKGSLSGLKWKEDIFFKFFPPETHIPQVYLSEFINLLHLDKKDLQQNVFVLLWSNIATNEAYRALSVIKDYIKDYEISQTLVIIINTDISYRRLLKK